MSQTAGDPKDVALRALAHLIRLMGAELTSGRHRDDVDLLECAVRFNLQSLARVSENEPGGQAEFDLASQYVDEAIKAIRRQASSLPDDPSARKPGKTRLRSYTPGAIH